MDNSKEAIAMLRKLSSLTDDAHAILDAGIVAEQVGDASEAARLYREIEDDQQNLETDNPRQQARRRLARLAGSRAGVRRSPEDLAEELFKVLEAKDGEGLRALAAPGYFMVGPIGGHLEFDDGEALEGLVEALEASEVRAREPLVSGDGDRFYLNTQGWQGDTVAGDASLLLLRTPRGWEWSGVAILPTTKYWKRRWETTDRETNQPLPFYLYAPWLSPRNATAGGLGRFIHDSGLAAGFGPLAYFAARALSRRPCGFGPRGLYFHERPTHTGEDAFAVDFTHTRSGDPWRNSSHLMTAAVPRIGIVASACGTRPSGDSNLNYVEILHDDRPATAAGTNRFLSRYLHLAGPSRISVLPGMLVIEGDTMGPCDNTGNSALDHLHFSIHDQTRAISGPPTERTPRASACGGVLNRGASVRPTPLDGQRLNDSDNGKCFKSRTAAGTVYYQGGPGFTQLVVIRRRP